MSHKSVRNLVEEEKRREAMLDSRGLFSEWNIVEVEHRNSNYVTISQMDHEDNYSI